jgi:serine/threonine protein kinase
MANGVHGAQPGARRPADEPGLLAGPSVGPAEHLLVGRYRLGARLGAGGMGEVFRAYDARLHRPVAVKRLHAPLEGDAAAYDRFLSEARKLAKVDHPNVVRLLDFETTHDGKPFFVMELVEGGSLETALRARGRLSVATAVELIRQVLRGLRAIHAQGIVHRDLTSTNVLVVSRDEPSDGELPEETDLCVKIADFGIAKTVNGASGPHTRQGQFVGTADYIAPEVIEGALRNPTPALDVYAVGVLLFRLLTGRSPWYGCTTAELFRLKQAGALGPLAEEGWGDIPDPLRAIVLRAMNASPATRYPTAQQLRDALGGWVQGQQRPDAPPDEAAPRNLIAERYRVEEVLEADGPRSTLRCVDTADGRVCDVTLLSGGATPRAVAVEQRLLQDAATVATLYHPAVARVYATGRCGQRSYIAAEPLGGSGRQPLRQIWHQLDWSRLRRLITQVADGLESVHQLGVVHRGLSSLSIWVAATGEVKLSGWAVSPVEAGWALSWAAASATLAFVAPEQVLAPAEVTAAADQWALAAIVYEALTGQTPYQQRGQGTGWSETVLAPFTPGVARTRNPSICPELEAVLLRALSREPEDRFPSVAHFVQELTAIATPVELYPAAGAPAQPLSLPRRGAAPTESDLGSTTNDGRGFVATRLRPWLPFVGLAAAAVALGAVAAQLVGLGGDAAALPTGNGPATATVGSGPESDPPQAAPPARAHRAALLTPDVKPRGRTRERRPAHKSPSATGPAQVATVAAAERAKLAVERTAAVPPAVERTAAVPPGAVPLAVERTAVERTAAVPPGANRGSHPRPPAPSSVDQGPRPAAGTTAVALPAVSRPATVHRDLPVLLDF